jgi:hypothetical protein
MTKTPFTQGDLAQLWQDEGQITMDILRKRLPDWTDRQTDKSSLEQLESSQGYSFHHKEQGNCQL